ncbi:MAG: molybdopterin molybdotransferase MoeA [Actinomycetota bacterium]
MRSVAEHLRECLAGIHPLPVIVVPAAEAVGAVLADKVISSVALPGFDNSAMDGYAVHSVDVTAAHPQSPVELPVTADIPAGSAQQLALNQGTAMRIMTGAPVPAGADGVVPVELSDGSVTLVRLVASITEGQHIRRAGEDVAVGQTVLQPGITITPGTLALLVSVGLVSVPIHARPRVSVLSTGSELVQPGELPKYGQVVDSNGIMLAAAARAAGGVVRQVTAVPDDASGLRRVLAEESACADLIITSGGVSAGAYDTVKEVLRREASCWFGKVAMQPGMPQGVGMIDGTPIITVPGNPASALVSFEVFARPMIRRLAGCADPQGAWFPAVAAHAWSSPAGKTQFARARSERDSSGRQTVQVIGGQGSFALTGVALANVLAMTGEVVTSVAPGDEIQCLLIGREW